MTSEAPSSGRSSIPSPPLKSPRPGSMADFLQERIVSITTGTMALDETSRIQRGGRPAPDNDPDNHDFGVGSLAGITVPNPLNAILQDALTEGGSQQTPSAATTTVALSGSTEADP